MKRSIALGLGIVIGLGGSAMGQESPRMTTDTTITMGASEYRICQDRPPRPDWIENIAVKEAYRVAHNVQRYMTGIVTEQSLRKTMIAPVKRDIPTGG